MSPNAKARLALVGIIAGGYLLVNAAAFAVLALPLQLNNSLESIVASFFAVTLLFTIGIVLLVYGIRYRRKAKAQMIT